MKHGGREGRAPPVWSAEALAELCYAYPGREPPLRAAGRPQHRRLVGAQLDFLPGGTLLTETFAAWWIFRAGFDESRLRTLWPKLGKVLRDASSSPRATDQGNAALDTYNRYQKGKQKERRVPVEGPRTPQEAEVNNPSDATLARGPSRADRFARVLLAWVLDGLTAEKAQRPEEALESFLELIPLTEEERRRCRGIWGRWSNASRIVGQLAHGIGRPLPEWRSRSSHTPGPTPGRSNDSWLSCLLFRGPGREDFARLFRTLSQGRHDARRHLGPLLMGLRGRYNAGANLWSDALEALLLYQPLFPEQYAQAENLRTSSTLLEAVDRLALGETPQGAPQGPCGASTGEADLEDAGPQVVRALPLFRLFQCWCQLQPEADVFDIEDWLGHFGTDLRTAAERAGTTGLEPLFIMVKGTHGPRPLCGARPPTQGRWSLVEDFGYIRRQPSARFAEDRSWLLQPVDLSGLPLPAGVARISLALSATLRGCREAFAQRVMPSILLWPSFWREISPWISRRMLDQPLGKVPLTSGKPDLLTHGTPLALMQKSTGRHWTGSRLFQALSQAMVEAEGQSPLLIPLEHPPDDTQTKVPPARTPHALPNWGTKSARQIACRAGSSAHPAPESQVAQDPWEDPLLDLIRCMLGRSDEPPPGLLHAILKPDGTTREWHRSADKGLLELVAVADSRGHSRLALVWSVSLVGLLAWWWRRQECAGDDRTRILARARRREQGLRGDLVEIGDILVPFRSPVGDTL